MAHHEHSHMDHGADAPTVPAAPATMHDVGSHGNHADHGPAHHAHDKHAGHSVAMFRDRFWLSLLLTVPILIWSEMVQDWLGYTAPTFPLSSRIPAIFG